MAILCSKGDKVGRGTIGCRTLDNCVRIGGESVRNLEKELYHRGERTHQIVPASSTGSLGSWVEVSRFGPCPAVRVQVGMISDIPSDSLLEGLQALLPLEGTATSGSKGCSPSSFFRDESEGEAGERSMSSMDEESFVRMASVDHCAAKLLYTHS